MKRLIAFDLDGTLAESKTPIRPEMADLLRQLLRMYPVAVTGGGKFELFQEQLLDRLQATRQELSRLHILPTNGNKYYRYNADTKNWHEVYSQQLPAEQKKQIASVLEKTAKELGYWEPKVWGERIEDRGSQVTFSALGQEIAAKLGEEGLRLKAAWDPDGSKKKHLRDAVARQLPEVSVRTAGMTSVDVTLAGLDKATALDKLKDSLGISKDSVIYIGDALAPGGNDRVVKDAGFDVITVEGPEDTARYIKKLIQHHLTKP